VYAPDLAPWGGYTGVAALTCVGWLSKHHPFQTGELAPAAITALRSFKNESVRFWIACGVHRCEFCPPAGPWTVETTSNWEILVPAIGAIYVAPASILHYIEAHQYKPPDEFIDAFMACPRQMSDEWAALMRQSPFFAERLGLTTR
jgi:hypothetical protein